MSRKYGVQLDVQRRGGSLDFTGWEKRKNRTNRNTKKRNRNSDMCVVRNTERNWVDGGEEGGWRTAGDFLLVDALGGWVGAEKWRW